MRLLFDARARRLMRRLPVVNVYSAAELLLMAGLAIQAARLVWAVVTPVGPLGDWRPAAPVAATGLPSDFDPFFRLAAPAQTGVVTALQLTLFGTRVDEATGRGSAIVAGPDGVQNSFAIGDEVVPGVRLKAVYFDHVTVDHGGAAEDLYLDQSDAVQPINPGAGAPAPSPLAAPPADAALPVGRIRTEIGFTPRIDDGRLSGLTLRPQGSGALFRDAGLQPGDVLTEIGGRPVTGVGDLDRIATDFAGGGRIPLTVERNGQPVQLAITVAPTK